MTAKTQYFKNSIFNYGGFFVNTVITFLITPFVISSLGDHLYGYWTVIVAFTGYFGFLDFGVRAGVGQYITRYLASKDYRSYNEIVGTALVSLGLIGCLGILLSLLVAFVVGPFFFDAKTLTSSFKLSLLLVGVAISIKFPFIVFQTTLQGIHRYDITGGIGIICKCINAACICFVLTQGYGVLGLAYVTFGSQLLEGAVMGAVALRKIPETRIRLSLHHGRLREITGYGIFSFWNNLADQITFYLGPLIVGQQLGAVAVTYYSVAANIMPYLVNLVQAASTPLMQVATSHDARGEDSANQKLYLYGTRYIFLLVCFVSINIYVAGEDFLGRWLGARYISGITYPSSGDVLRVLVIGYMGYLSHAVGRQILFGKRLNRFLAMAASISAVSVIAATCFLGKAYGIVGAALGLTMPLLIVNAVILPLYTARSVEVPFTDLLKTAIAPALASFILTLLAIRVMPDSGVSPATWMGIVTRCVTTSTCFLIATTIFYFSDILSFARSRGAAETP